MQRAQKLTASQGRVGRFRCYPRGVDILPDNCVELVVVPIDAIQKHIEQGFTADLSLLELTNQGNRRFKVCADNHRLPPGCFS